MPITFADEKIETVWDVGMVDHFPVSTYIHLPFRSRVRVSGWRPFFFFLFFFFGIGGCLLVIRDFFFIFVFVFGVSEGGAACDVSLSVRSGPGGGIDR